MAKDASQSGNFRSFITQVRITVDQMKSRPYVRFSQAGVWEPKINIYETPESICVCVDAAGMRAEGFDVDVGAHRLVIRGQRARPMPESGGEEMCVHLMEIDIGAFRRTIELSTAVDTARVSADYREGLLWITMPKAG